MTTLSPLDALGPAFRRTREVMAQPFRLGFFLKIALVAALTQPAFYSTSISYPIQGAQFAALRSLGARSAVGGYGSSFAAETAFPGPNFGGLAVFGIAAFAVLAVVGLLIWIGIAYLYCRLRFTLFDLVVSKRGRVRQAWSGYGPQAWRYFGLVLLVGLAFLVVSLVIIGPALLNFIHTVVPLAKAGTSPDPFALLGSMLPFVLSIFLVAALWAVVDALMQDFLLPPMAIEDAPLESAFGRFFRLLRTDLGSVVVYVLLRFAVGIGLTWILMLAVFLALLLAGLATFGVGVLLYHLLWASLAGQVVCVALAILAGIVALVVYLAAIVSVYGISAVFKQSYAAYFFGGRYPELGDRLEPPAPSLVVEEATGVEPPSPPATTSILPPFAEAPPVW
jgi:hypothetical protein